MCTPNVSLLHVDCLPQLLTRSIGCRCSSGNRDASVYVPCALHTAHESPVIMQMDWAFHAACRTWSSLMFLSHDPACDFGALRLEIAVIQIQLQLMTCIHDVSPEIIA